MLSRTTSATGERHGWAQLGKWLAVPPADQAQAVGSCCWSSAMVRRVTA
ncbi:hypothetical protein OG196_42935 (plasmid) [Kitasatospora purpeofusca]|nr:hypothetical protein OG196_42935 [Kitasatospora purpeofusca]